MEEPLDELVAELVKVLDAGQREDFEERAGIIEFCSKVPRAQAEQLALRDVLHRHPSVLDGLKLCDAGTELMQLVGEVNLSN